MRFQGSNQRTHLFSSDTLIEVKRLGYANHVVKCFLGTLQVFVELKRSVYHEKRISCHFSRASKVGNEIDFHVVHSRKNLFTCPIDRGFLSSTS